MYQVKKGRKKKSRKVGKKKLHDMTRKYKTLKS